MTKTSRTAIALHYDGRTTPKLTARGEDEIAEEIIRIALEHGVPLYENAALADSLSQLAIGEEIPELLYRVIAEIIAFAYVIQGRRPVDGVDAVS